MMEEAPKEIFLTNSDLADDWDWVDTEGISWCAEQINTTDIEYIRKDIYDAMERLYERQIERLRDGDLRIKELEEALRFYSTKDNFELVEYTNLNPNAPPLYADLVLEEATDKGLVKFGTTASKALEKESE